MNNNKNLYISVTCFLLAILTAMWWNQRKEEVLADHISPEILRFHILANSNTDDDQALKLDVRNYMLNLIYEQLGENASLEQTKLFCKEHKLELEQAAETYMRTLGFSYSAHMELTNCYFPTKTYGDMVFPAGHYEAVRIIIGAGRGKNWWCVLYPPLCFIDSTYAVVPDTSKEMLQESLSPEDFQALLSLSQNIPVSEQPDLLNSKESPSSVQVRFKILDLITHTQ